MNEITNPNRKIMQRIAWFFIVLMVNQIAFPVAALALTTGPAQPEYSSFVPAGSTEMVDLFSGDFNYNVPLLEVPGPNGGYPINLFYNSVSGMNQEASWTGLGWNINVGSMGRSMRGLPDDFNGEEVSRRLDARKSETVRVGTEGGVEIGGIDLAKSISMSLGVSLGISYVYNSYKGAGVSIDPMIHLGVTSGGGKGGYSYTPDLSLGMSVSTIDAASANVGFSLGRKQGKNTDNLFGGSLNFNAADGLSSMSLGSGYLGVSGGISFGTRSYTPSAQRAWTGTSFLWDLSFMGGGTVVYGKWGLSGSYSEEYFVDAGLLKGEAAYGYNYLQNAGASNLLDFNREKDGPVNKYKHYLANSVMTYDVYNVAAQGLSGVFRSHRSDVGFLNDPSLSFDIPGGSFGAEGGVWLEFGLNGAYNWKKVDLSDWPYIGWVNFKSKEANNLFEPFYYQMEGDVSAEAASTYDYLGDGTARDKPMRLKLDGFDYRKWNGGELEVEKNDGSGNPWFNNGGYETKVQWDTDKNHRDERKKRNVSIQQITNKELIDNQGKEVLSEYNIKYYDETAIEGAKSVATYANDPEDELTRSGNDQNAGFTVLGGDGVRWNYALPILNTEQREAKFSVAPQTCSNKVAVIGTGDDINYKPSSSTLRSTDYIDEQTMPEYAHTYLLTSVVGNDYADIDGELGPSDGDAGYWMKTNYVKLSNGYQWRAPFLGANYIPGIENNVMDDLGAFTWGQREVYLPASIETKTHIAYFEVSRRYDARGAQNYIQNTGGIPADKVGEFSYKLDKILLYSKKDISTGGIGGATPLKTVNFKYDYSLCVGADNNDNNATISAAENSNILNLNTSSPLGKLTLKEVFFTYENSNRGELSPYKFDYNATNPEYNETKIDRWGVYRATPLNSNYNECDNINLPYTNQSPSNKPQLDEEIGAWHLEKITMPSGATLNLEIERDDYAYVQDAKATRMFNITSTHKTTDAHNQLVSFDPSDDNRYIQFELETPIPTASSNAQEQLNAYVNDLPQASRQGVDYKQLYYKVRMNLRNASIETWEYVPGYAEIDKNGDGTDAIEFVSPAGSSYTHARIRLRQSRIHSKWKQHHPISMRALKFLKDKMPDQMLAADLGGPPNAMTSLDQMGESIKALFSGYYDYGLVSEGFAQNIELERSFIRLNTPDKVQYGGGSRVKSILLEDGWNPSETSTMGVVYDYTKTDNEGNTYSSGVLENEISAGYDECALRWAVVQEEVRDGQVKDVHDYQYPMNEAYYPRANVGYSQVTVRSLASDYALKASKEANPVTYLAALDLPEGFGTTGQTVYEYYTAKDFPVITSRTSLDKNETNPWLGMFIQMLTMTRHDYYTGSQGYSIELNDMHGKTKKVSTYGQTPDGKVKENPLTTVEYKYKTKKVVDFKRGKSNQQVNVITNEVEVLLADSPQGQATTESQLLGVDYDFFIDGREYLQTTGSAGLAFNTDAIVWWPFPFPWPQFNLNRNCVRTSVTNKIIKRRAILEQVLAFDGQATLITTNKVFDAQTGAPLLATVNNQLGGEIYNYSVPAYMAHDRMGAAAENWGTSFSNVMFNPTAVTATDYYELDVPHNQSDLWYEGDEFIATIGTGKCKAIYMGELYNDVSTKTHQFDILDASLMTGSSPISISLKNVRSGNRNLVGATVAQYSTVDVDGGNNANPLLAANRTVAATAKPTLMNITTVGSEADLVPFTGAGITHTYIDNVLSASAADFSDDWTLGTYNYCRSLENANPYRTGEKGVWRARSSYAYVDERKQENLVGFEHNNEVDLRTSGTVDNLAMFNWKNPMSEFCDESKWIRTQDVTKYQIGGASVESRDVLGAYQAVLYAYDNNLVVAQGANSKYNELGYEGFEEANTTGSLQSVSNSTGVLNNGHFDFLPNPTSGSFVCTTTTPEQHENYRLTYPMYKPSGSNKSYVLVRKPYHSSNPTSVPVTLHLKNANSEQTVNGIVSNQFKLNVGTSSRYKAPGLTHMISAETQDEFTVYEIDFTGINHDLGAEDWWAGELVLRHSLGATTINSTNSNDVISSLFAHTGKYSLLLNNELPSQDEHKYPINTLQLQEGKNYVFSAWVRIKEDGITVPVATYATGTRGVSIGGRLLEPSGPIIEGWQRIQGEFSINGANTISFITGISSTTSEETGMYVDDIRMFPADGNMVSYVYDPINYKLKATLDDNNYATFYIYDESGSLISTKRETERGIVSIQESRSYVH